MKTIFVKPADVQRTWYVIDAAGIPLGRVAVKAASLLRGKHKPEFAPHQELGDYVVIINADKVALTGRKATQKVYYRHTGFPGGMKSETFAKLIRRRPEAPMEMAVKGMLPHNRLGRKLFNNLKVYAGPAHPHVAQQPQPIAVVTSQE